MPRRRLYGSRAPMVGGAKRETSWFFLGPASTANAGGGAASLVFVLNAAALARRPFTVVRTHLEVLVRTDNLATENIILGLGMAVVSVQSSAIGVTAVPTPINDAASDLFFLHQYFMINTLVSTSAGFEVPAGINKSLDSKAMRKVNDDQDIILTIEGSVDGCVVDIAGRFLVKEH